MHRKLRASRKGPSQNTRSELTVGQVLEGEGKYRILKPLSIGGRGQAFLAEVLENRCLPSQNSTLPKQLNKGAKVVIKTVHFDKDRNPSDIRDFIGDVNKTLAEEISLLPRLHGLKCAAKTFDSGLWRTFLSDQSLVPILFIVQEYVKGVNLIDYLNGKSKNDKPFSGITSAGEWFRLAKHLVTATKEIHQRIICHRDIWPSNIFIVAGKPVFIDFGEAAYRNETSLPLSLNSPKPHPYLAPEYRSGRRWPTRKADLYSIGGVLYYMAFGKDPPLNPNKDDDLLKRSIIREMESKNAKLMAGNSGIADIIARCLRFNRQKRVQDAEALLQELRNFDLQARPPSTKLALGSVQRQIRALSTEGNELFARIAEVELRQLECRIQDMTNGILDITGGHEEIVYGLTQYLSILREGDEYLAVSTPQFWAAGNMGINGRYLTMNRLIAQRGVKIRRVFLLTEKEYNSVEVRDIFRAHLRLHKHLPESKKTMVETRYLVMSSHQRKLAIKRGKHFGIWIKRDGMMTIIPVYDDRNVITTVRLRRPEESESILRKRFAEYFEHEKALPLERRFGRKHKHI